ncbi:2-oxoglutarate:acceptor oxidoreductase [Streptococcus panodentis]|uniref:2-oxoglutarate:acceptor oxidoreductase n=1 Tax=Streptococcus panodentis TaxID=1581472 RepID=A0ABS5ATZ2_9STRE|nr:2-oxoglutarate:acceptor oxidoreductase [Streptococcus panodentis]MBP2619926.1 2-oxoglutarate:acceptor oxidoreductase [Streptococcus panodentis]
MEKQVKYKGMPCWLLEAEEPFPARVQLISPDDLSKAIQEGFSCWGYPNEIMKEVSAEEYNCLACFGRFPLN